MHSPDTWDPPNTGKGVGGGCTPAPESGPSYIRGASRGKPKAGQNNRRSGAEAPSHCACRGLHHLSNTTTTTTLFCKDGSSREWFSSELRQGALVSHKHTAPSSGGGQGASNPIARNCSKLRENCGARNQTSRSLKQQPFCTGDTQGTDKRARRTKRNSIARKIAGNCGEFYCLRQCTSKRVLEHESQSIRLTFSQSVSQSGRQAVNEAGRHAGRSTQLGFFGVRLHLQKKKRLIAAATDST